MKSFQTSLVNAKLNTNKVNLLLLLLQFGTAHFVPEPRNIPPREMGKVNNAIIFFILWKFTTNAPVAWFNSLMVTQFAEQITFRSRKRCSLCLQLNRTSVRSVKMVDVCVCVCAWVHMCSVQESSSALCSSEWVFPFVRSGDARTEMTSINLLCASLLLPFDPSAALCIPRTHFPAPDVHN